MDEKFLEYLNEVIDTESELTEETELSEIEEWDSLSMVSFVAMAQTTYGKIVKGSEIRKAKTVADLYNLVQ